MNANEPAISMLLGRGAEFWDAGMLWSLGVAALAAVAVGVFTTGSVITNKRLARAAEAQLETYKVETEEKVSAANAKASAAQEETARLQKEAAEARLKAEKLKSALSWRDFTPDQATVFGNSLHGQTVKATVLVANDPESIAFGQQILAAIQPKGVVVLEASRWMDPSAHDTDIVLWGRPAETELTRTAFQNAGLSVTVEAKDQVLMIGVLTKPRTLL